MPTDNDKARRNEAAGRRVLARCFTWRQEAANDHGVRLSLILSPSGNTVNGGSTPDFYAWTAVQSLPDDANPRPVVIEQFDTIRTAITVPVGPDLHHVAVHVEPLHAVRRLTA